MLTDGSQPTTAPLRGVAASVSFRGILYTGAVQPARIQNRFARARTTWSSLPQPEALSPHASVREEARARANEAAYLADLLASGVDLSGVAVVDGDVPDA
jgi:hypothetical protein